MHGINRLLFGQIIEGPVLTDIPEDDIPVIIPELRIHLPDLLFRKM
jgi:hypothetical protein